MLGVVRKGTALAPFRFADTLEYAHAVARGHPGVRVGSQQSLRVELISRDPPS
jgi:hypothetical protein